MLSLPLFIPCLLCLSQSNIFCQPPSFSFFFLHSFSPDAALSANLFAVAAAAAAAAAASNSLLNFLTDFATGFHFGLNPPNKQQELLCA